MMKRELLSKIKNRTLKIGVIGLGYVGLPLAVEKAAAGFKTIGFDINVEKVALINNGVNYIGDVVDNTLSVLVENGMLSATNDFSFVGDVDFIAVCVPTPLDLHGQPNISCVRDSAQGIARYLKKGSVVVLESTTYPGTTEELLKPILEKGSGLKCAKDFYLGFSPERVDPGNLIYKTKNTPKVVGGIDADATEVIAAVYRAVLDGEVYEAPSPAVAEMEKLLENTYRNINIALINELTVLCHRMGISVWDVIDAAKTKPYGFMPFYPGPGPGGHCIPLDPSYLAWKAREYGFHTSMIEAAAMINDNMPDYCAQRVAELLNKNKKAVNGSKILVLGVAYKADVDDCRESAALKLMSLLEQQGASVCFYDPHIRQYTNGAKVRKGAESLTESILESSDLVIITAAHTAYDYDFIQKHARLIFDTKNAMKGVVERGNVVLL